MSGLFPAKTISDSKDSTVLSNSFIVNGDRDSSVFKAVKNSKNERDIIKNERVISTVCSMV